MTTIARPGGELATRPLHFIFVADCSTSMKFSGKMDALNQAVRDAIPHMRRVAEENPNAQVLVRVIRFSTGAHWQVSVPTPVEEFEWTDLDPVGVTDMGKAFGLLTEALTMPPMSDRALPPVLVLISDGIPTDEYQESLAKMLALPWGTKAVKLAIAIGKAVNKQVLKDFINSEQIDVLQADNAARLIEYIKWASTVVLQAASSPASQTENTATGNVAIPRIPENFWDDLSIDVEDVW